MRRFYVLLILCVLSVAPLASAKSARIVKVLPEFLDLEGRNTISPSLYERDGYQATLRKNAKLRSALNFYVQWKGADSGNLKMRVQMRGVHANTVNTHTQEQPVKNTGWFSTWTSVKFDGEEYKSFGDLIAWRVTLWDGDKLLSEQKSFLWQE